MDARCSGVASEQAEWELNAHARQFSSFLSKQATSKQATSLLTECITNACKLQNANDGAAADVDGDFVDLQCGCGSGDTSQAGELATWLASVWSKTQRSEMKCKEDAGREVNENVFSFETPGVNGRLREQTPP